MTKVLSDVEDTLIQFSMDRARDEAWRSAERFWSGPEAGGPAAIHAQDNRMLWMAGRPGVFLTTVIRIVRVGEVQDVTKVIDILASPTRSVAGTLA